MSKTNKQQVPKIRFEGFSDTWKRKKISDLSETTIGGGTPSTSNGKYWEGEIPWIQSSDITVDDVLNITPTKFITKEALQHSAARLVPEDSLAIVTRVGVGKLCILPYKYATSQDFLSLVNLNIDKFYITYNLYRFLQEEKHKVQGTAIKGITKADLLNKKILISESLEEQTAIGNFFQQLDKLIELQTRAVESAETYKKAMLQKMFPQKGEKVPRVRFEGFSGDWVEKSLHNIATIIAGGTPDTKVSEYWNGDINWFAPAEIGKQIYAENSIRKITKLGLQKSSAKILPAMKTILFTSRAGIGDMAILKIEACTNQGFQSLVVKDEFDVYFIYSMGSFIKQQALKIASGSTFLEISGKALGSLVQKYPSIEEQTQIGNYFQKLDQNIESEKKKLEQYQTMKRAMLQRMFV